MASPSPLRTDEASLIASVAREVIRRLREDEQDNSTCSGEKLITLETLDRLAGTAEIVATGGAVVTPAAREEAQRRGIRIRHAGATAGQTHSSVRPDETDALSNQLNRKGIQLPTGIELVWSETPATDVFERCAKGIPAAMVTAIGDVDRFAGELNPRAWILDRERLNLTAAVNIARRISARGTSR